MVQAAGAEQPGKEPAEDVDAEEDDVDVFLVESVEADADEEMPQSAVAAPLQGNSSPWRNGAKGRWGNGEAKPAESRKDRRELEPSGKAAAPAEEKAAETNPEMPPQRLCSIMLSSPIQFPRKQKLPEAPKVPLDKAPAEQPAGKAHKKVGESNPLGEMRNSSGLNNLQVVLFLVKSKEHSEENKLFFH